MGVVVVRSVKQRVFRAVSHLMRGQKYTHWVEALAYILLSIKKNFSIYYKAPLSEDIFDKYYPGGQLV